MLSLNLSNYVATCFIHIIHVNVEVLGFGLGLGWGKVTVRMTVHTNVKDI